MNVSRQRAISFVLACVLAIAATVPAIFGGIGGFNPVRRYSASVPPEGGSALKYQFVVDLDKELFPRLDWQFELDREDLDPATLKTDDEARCADRPDATLRRVELQVAVKEIEIELSRNAGYEVTQ